MSFWHFISVVATGLSAAALEKARKVLLADLEPLSAASGCI